MIAKCKKRDQILSRYHNNADKGDTETKNEDRKPANFSQWLCKYSLCCCTFFRASVASKEKSCKRRILGKQVNFIFLPNCISQTMDKEM